MDQKNRKNIVFFKKANFSHDLLVIKKIVYNEKSITDKTCSEYKLYYNSYGVCEIPDYNTGAP